jgi:hypothetical protein
MQLCARREGKGVGEKADWLWEGGLSTFGGFTIARRLRWAGSLVGKIEGTKRRSWPAVIEVLRAVVRSLFPPGQGTPLKAFLIILLLCVSGCSWFHRKPHAPDPTELVVVGAPVGSMVFVDGVQAGRAKQVAKQPQEVEVAPGTHIVEVRVGDTVAYRENTYVTQGEKHVISVLSGRN